LFTISIIANIQIKYISKFLHPLPFSVFFLFSFSSLVFFFLFFFSLFLASIRGLQTAPAVAEIGEVVVDGKFRRWYGIGAFWILT